MILGGPLRSPPAVAGAICQFGAGDLRNFRRWRALHLSEFVTSEILYIVQDKGGQLVDRDGWHGARER